MINVTNIVDGLNPSGLDPELEAKAEQYAKREWQMSVKPMLDKVFNGKDELPIETIAELQEALFQHKYEVLLVSDNKKEEAKAKNLRWA